MFNKELANKLDNFIKEKFSVIYDYKFNGIVLLYGGTIKNIVMGMPVHDLDFLILTQDECKIIDFIRKFKLEYTMNASGGYKIYYNDFWIDMCSHHDLLDTGIYDIDLLFYDIDRHVFISCGAFKAIENRVITEINDEKNPLYSNKARLKKLIKFVKYTSHSDKKVKVKQNKLLWEYKMFKRKIKVGINKTILGNFRKCFRFLNDYQREYILMFMFGLIITLISMIFPTLLGKVIIEVMRENYKIIFRIVFIMFFLRGIYFVLSYFYSKLSNVVKKKMLFNMKEEIIKNKFNIDDVNDDYLMISDSFINITDRLIKGLGNIGLLLYIFYLDYRIGIILSILMIIIFKVRITGIRKGKTYGKVYDGYQNKGVGANHLNDSEFKNTIRVFDYDKAEYYNNLYNRLFSVSKAFSLMIILVLGLFLVQYDFLDSEALIIIFMYHSLIFVFLDNLEELVNFFAKLNGSCNRIFNLLVTGRDDKKLHDNSGN